MRVGKQVQTGGHKARLLKVLPGANHNRIAFHIDFKHIEGHRKGDAKPSALTHGIEVNPVMVAEDVPIPGYDLALFERHELTQESPVVAFGYEADILTLPNPCVVGVLLLHLLNRLGLDPGCEGEED